jgi:hypothetical protein
MPSDGFVTKCNNWLRSSRHHSVKTGTRGGDGRTARHAGRVFTATWSAEPAFSRRNGSLFFRTRCRDYALC